MTRKSFHLGDLLSVSTGRLVSPTHMDGIYDILSHMVSRSLQTIEIPAAMDRCRPILLAQFPFLADIAEPILKSKDEVDAWLEAQVALYGKRFDVEQLP